MSCCALEGHDESVKKKARTLLLATDFDGTVAPIVSRPFDAAISPLAHSVLDGCSRSQHVVVAVITGRDIGDVRPRLNGLKAIIAGSHGLECAGADGTPLWQTANEIEPLPDDLTGDLSSAGFLVEKKRFSIAIHYRTRPDRAVEREPLARFAMWAQQQQLTLIDGRKVFEARVPGRTKGQALRELAALFRCDRVVYAGDDSTDFDALSFAASRGRGIFVESTEHRTPVIPSLSVARSIEDLCWFFTMEMVDRGSNAVERMLLPAGPHVN